MNDLAFNLRRSVELERQRGNDPVGSALKSLNDTLQGSANKLFDARVAQAINDPKRIGRIVYGVEAWPSLDDDGNPRSLDDVLDDCHTAMDQTEDWSDLEIAESALMQMIEDKANEDYERECEEEDRNAEIGARLSRWASWHGGQI